MQYKVPQFIEVEDKIFGPFTIKQFSYLAGGFGLSIIVWRTFDSGWVVFLIAPIIAFALALAFVKPNGKPFIVLVQNFLGFIFRPKKLFWKSPGIEESKENVAAAKKEEVAQEKKDEGVKQKLFSHEQIENLAKNLDEKN